MIQCFVNHPFTPTFSNGNQPKLLSASRIDASYSIHPRIMHNHKDFAEILFVRSGSGMYVIESERYPIQQGDLIICNSGVLHDEMPEENQDLNTYCIAIKEIRYDNLPPNALIPSDARPVIPSGEDFEDLLRLYSVIYNQLASGCDGRDEIAEFATLALLRIVKRITVQGLEPVQEPRSDLRVLSNQIKDYIDTHYSDELNLEVIAGAMNLSPYYLSHVFKKITGYSPMQYTLRRRIGEAQTLLITTELSITDIASRVGYGNPNYFNVIFTKNIGMSPSKYRKSYIERNK
ncbi:AraC family transcriptional regulator [Anaerotalea alkaliphila]|uniref:AraC family transcriptional regulator n=1 Tax=Anaerotalea alkaliphila TaxID=2662126 RepID=A0A7X5HXD5_9FIRM|nr:AraC family transcriptional regulator [Anaerotalea alkaliphila]NDL68380.1 AraC family transcriptional regulator [Anaerotalea alkaliphila]